MVSALRSVDLWRSSELGVNRDHRTLKHRVVLTQIPQERAESFERGLLTLGLGRGPVRRVRVHADLERR